MTKIFTTLPQNTSSRQRVYFANFHRFLREHRSIFLSFIFAFIATLSFLAVKNLSVSQAKVAGFDPGNIMSDYVMSNTSTMTEADIQQFLKSKNPCNNTDTHLANYYPHLQYNIRDGHFVCMADDTFNGETAAHIIWQAAQDYKINPQVILVLLEKEQGLISDTWPNHVQYRTATGYGCPDTASCDAQYFGLKNQIRKAAALFREVLDGGWTNYPLGNTYIQYNPDPTCGGSYVNIRSLATSALYRYTPYQPNAGALANHPGTAPCGAYGNRNFYSFFTDWFGSTHNTPTDPYKTISMKSNFIPNGTYSFLTSAGKALDVSGGKGEVGDNIQIWRDNGTDAQKFTVNREEDGFYTIKNIISDKALDVEGGSHNFGANIHLWKTNGTCAQKWGIIRKGDYYIFKSACSGNALDVSGGTIDNAGSNIQSWRDNGSNAQMWKSQQ